MKDKNAWNSYDKEELAKLEKLCKAYREFLDAGKTERECVKEIVKQVKKAGYEDIQDVIKEGDSLTVNMGESLEFDGKTYPIHPLPDNLMDIINAGGLVKAMQKRNGII